MRISDSQPTANDADVSSRDTDSSQRAEKDESSKFAKVLAKKHPEGDEAAKSKDGKPSGNDLDPANLGLMQIPKGFEASIQAAQVDGKRVVAVPPELQQLVREISVVVNSADRQQVHIELNSNVLKGLHIRIDRQDGAVAIQFQSTSDQVSNLLTRNIDALSQGLADRGVNVSDIRVSRPQEYARARDSKSSGSNSGGSGQGGRQGGRR
jgi:flagellar hook-length control protein FliK